MKVMIVDDSASVRSLLRMILAPSGCEIVECSDGTDAVAQYGAERPQLVVMDVEMERMDGMEAASIILSGFPDANIVITSHRNDAWLEQKAVSIGARCYVPKDVLFRIPKLLRSYL